MTETIQSPPHHHTDRKTGVRYQWGGLKTAHCSHCHESFTSVDGFDRHFIVNSITGEMHCFDPADVDRRDGGPAFEKIEKPTWNPPHVWSRTSVSRGEHPNWSDA